jgi:hypothetical protein
MTEQLDNQGEAREALSSLVNDYSKRVLSDPRMLGNIVTDLLPDLPRERSLLVTAAEADVAGELTRHVEEHHLDPDTAVQLVARSLTDRRALDPAASTWVTTEYAQALGYRVRSDAAPPPSAPPGGGYAPPPPGGGFAPPPQGGYAPPSPTPAGSTAPTTDPQPDWQHQQTAPGGGYSPPSSPGGGYSPPSSPGGGYAPPSGGGYSPPSGGGYAPPSGGGYSPPSSPGGGYAPPSGGGYSAPPSGGGYVPPSGGGYGPPPGGQSVPPLPGQMPWGPPTPPSRKRNLVPLLTAGGLALVVVLYFAVAAVAKIAPFSSSKATPTSSPTHHPSPHVSRTPTPRSTNPEPGLAAGVAPLTQLLPSDVNPVNCKTAQKPQWSNPGLVKGLACYDSALGNSGDSIFAYQMNSSDNYKSAWANFNTWWGIKPPSGSGCPPSSGQTQGSVPWDDTGSAGGGYFPTTSGQVLECGLLGSKGNEPTYAWAFPTEDAYIIAIGDPGTTFSAIDTWWTNNSDPNASPKPYTPATP